MLEQLEQAYDQANFARDFAEARRLYRLLASTPYWPAERVLREAHKCGAYDEGSYDQDEVVVVAVAMAQEVAVAQEVVMAPGEVITAPATVRPAAGKRAERR